MNNPRQKKTGAPVSIKKHFSLFLFLNCTATLLLIGTVSCITIYTIHENTTQATILGALDTICMTMSNTYDSLDNTAKQLAYEDLVVSSRTISDSLRRYLDFLGSQSEYSDQEKLELVSSKNYLHSSVHFIASVNPNVGLALFYRAVPEKTILFSSASALSGTLQVPEDSYIQDYGLARFHGLHASVLSPFSPVISVERRVSGLEDVYVYVEAGAGWFRTLLENSHIGGDPVFLMTDSQATVIFSTHPEQIPPGTQFQAASLGGGKASFGNYFLFSSARDDYHVAMAIPKWEYNKEITAWFGHFLLIVLFSLILTVSLAILMWRSLYHPIHILHREFQLMAANSPVPVNMGTGIKEFNELLEEFHDARYRVFLLMQQMTEQKTQQMRLEIDKLRMQINPHFIHNTLNSIQWMARLHQEPEIEQMATLFSRILKYNLEGEDIFASLQEELLAIQSYIDLQKIRYQFALEASFQIDEGLGQVKLPRFILQPLVENAIFHGMNRGRGSIQIRAARTEENCLTLQVIDSGPGIPPDKLRKIAEENLKSEEHTGFGLGLKYVNSTIRFYYGEEYHLTIDSTQDAGTTVSLLLPCSPVCQESPWKGADYDQSLTC